METQSITRELALLVLGQVAEHKHQDVSTFPFEDLLSKALDSLINHWREGLDECASELGIAQQIFHESEFEEFDPKSITSHLDICFLKFEKILNTLSGSIDIPRLLILADQDVVRKNVIKRVKLVIEKRNHVDQVLDNAMEGWRLKRLPRIDRDILRLAVVDIISFDTPLAVTCNEAVELANRYSDDQGRRMINGVLRRLQNSSLSSV